MYSVRKVRGENKYAVRFKTVDGYVIIVAYDTREDAQTRMRKEIYDQVDREKEQDILNDSDTEIDV